MLVLGRKPGETITLGGGITIMVLSVHGHQVRLGIEAPAGTKILRGELVPCCDGGSACDCGWGLNPPEITMGEKE